jgi:GntR family transcriptional regulator
MIDIDPASPVPLYMQIVEQVRRRIVLGALRPGDRLPTVRELAVRTRVNRNTAARAIQRLEQDGLVRTRQRLERDGLVRTRVGQGTFVVRAAARGGGPEQRAALDGSIDRLLIESRTLGVSFDELVRRLRRRRERLDRTGASGAGSEERR